MLYLYSKKILDKTGTLLKNAFMVETKEAPL